MLDYRRVLCFLFPKNNAVTDAILDITLPFGIGDAEFIPPYSPEKQRKYLSVESDGDVRLGLYRNPKGRLLAVVGNFGKNRCAAKLTFTEKGAVTERRTGKSLGNGPAVAVEIEPHNFIILEK